MEAAKTEWLKKATEIYSDATMETAKDPKVMCASQGLYSNCTITAFPCGTVPVPPESKLTAILSRPALVHRAGRCLPTGRGPSTTSCIPVARKHR